MCRVVLGALVATFSTTPAFSKGTPLCGPSASLRASRFQIATTFIRHTLSSRLHEQRHWTRRLVRNLGVADLRTLHVATLG